MGSRMSAGVSNTESQPVGCVQHRVTTRSIVKWLIMMSKKAHQDETLCLHQDETPCRQVWDETPRAGVRTHPSNDDS
jgi:hypothetical protein